MLKKRQKPSAFYDRCQPSAEPIWLGPGKYSQIADLANFLQSAQNTRGRGVNLTMAYFNRYELQNNVRFTQCKR